MKGQDKTEQRLRLTVTKLNVMHRKLLDAAAKVRGVSNKAITKINKAEDAAIAALNREYDLAISKIEKQATKARRVEQIKLTRAEKAAEKIAEKLIDAHRAFDSYVASREVTLPVPHDGGGTP